MKNTPFIKTANYFTVYNKESLLNFIYIFNIICYIYFVKGVSYTYCYPLLVLFIYP